MAETGNEIQVVTVSATSGGYTLTLNGETTTAIAFDATAETVKAALVALPSIATTDLTVTGDAGGPYTIEFTGAYRDTDIPTMTSDPGGLVGGSQSATVSTTTEGNQPTEDIVYVDTSTPESGTTSLEVLEGQTPPPGHTRVDKS